MKNKTTIKVPVSYGGKLKPKRENDFTLNLERENVDVKSESTIVEVTVQYAGRLKPNKERDLSLNYERET